MMDYGAAPAMAAAEPRLSLPLPAGDRGRSHGAHPSCVVIVLAPALVLIAPDGITLIANRNDPHDMGDYPAYRNGGFGAIPASGKAIAALPKTTVGEESTAREKAECAVCLEGYETGQALRTMPCSHDFHESCITDWLRVSRMCPLCRFKLPAFAEESNADEEEEGEEGDDDSSTC